MRNYILLTLAVLAGILAFFISKRQLAQEYAKIKSQTETVSVVAVTRDIVAGEKIEAGDLAAIDMLRNQMTANHDYVLESQEWRVVVGERLLVPLRRGDALRWGYLNLQDMGLGANLLTRRIPKGERALSIAVDSVSSVSSMVRPNDRVDLIATFRFPPEADGSGLDQVTMTILQNVTVLAVGQQLAGAVGPTGTNRSYSTVTLSVTPEEAEMLVFAQQKGTMVLTLRTPADIEAVENPQNVNFDYLKRNLNRYNELRRERIGPAAVSP